MEKALVKKNISTMFWPTLLVMVFAFTMISIVFGVDSMMAGIHDTFHDFRHSIGITCH